MLPNIWDASVGVGKIKNAAEEAKTNGSQVLQLVDCETVWA